MSAIPSLPQHDERPDARRAAIERARDEYQYDYGYQSLCFLRSVPPHEAFDATYMKAGLLGSAKLAENHLEHTGQRLLEHAGGTLREAWHALWNKGEDPRAHLTKALRAKHIDGSFDSLDDFTRLYPALPPPLAMSHWQEDWSFAWQRMAGAVPVHMRRVTEPLDGFPVTDAHMERALGQPLRVQQALAQGRLFLCDYAMFHGMPYGVFPPGSGGLRKYVEAPLALFLATPKAKGGLTPVAIQCGQVPGVDNPIYTPADGIRWQIAKLAVQIADGNLEGDLVHFGYCHMIIQCFIMAAHRCLSPDHPLALLLAPHFRYTLAANQFAREHVANPGGIKDRLLGGTIEAQLAVLRDGIRAVELADLDPSIHAQRHGLDDREVIVDHPFRDDGLASWTPILAFVSGYVRVYYASDEDVANDLELRAMLDEIAAPDGGRLPRLIAGFTLRTVDDVIALMARIIFRASTYHAAINYSWYDWMGFIPNMPTAGFGPVPRPSEPATEQTLLRMLPPIQATWESIAEVYAVSSLAITKLGKLDEHEFGDPRVQPLITRFVAELADAETIIEERNRERVLPYRTLLPSQISASINS